MSKMISKRDDPFLIRDRTRLYYRDAERDCLEIDEHEFGLFLETVPNGVLMTREDVRALCYWLKMWLERKDQEQSQKKAQIQADEDFEKELMRHI